MIKVSILYPNQPNGRFDTDYYLDIHMPLALGKLGSAIKSVSVEFGISGPMPDQAPPYLALCHFICDTAQAFYDAFLPHADALEGDVANYTNIEPIIQISDIKLSR